MTSFPELLADRYRRFRFRHFEPYVDQYETLAEHGQSPEIMIVSCCDSRVAPETIFSALPGELFVVRNVANLVPPFETNGRYHGVSAALEFALLNLRVRHIVILAHSGCGGVKACLHENAARQTDAQFIANWVSMLDRGRERVLGALPDGPASRQERALELETIRTSLENLRTFPCVQTLEARGKLAMHGAHFDIGSGRLSAYVPGTDSFAEL